MLTQDDFLKIVAAYIRKAELKARDKQQTFYSRIKAEGAVEMLQEMQNELLNGSVTN